MGGAVTGKVPNFLRCAELKRTPFGTPQYSTWLLLCNPPRRELGPGLERVLGPLHCLVRMAAIARVRNLERFRRPRRNELEGMAANVDIRDGLLDLWHVAADAFTARGPGPVMCVLFDRRGSRAVRRVRAMAFQT